MHMLNPLDFVEPARPPTLFDLEADVCDVANFAAVCLDHVERLVATLRESKTISERQAASVSRILHTTSDAAESLIARYYAALTADFAAKKLASLEDAA